MQDHDVPQASAVYATNNEALINNALLQGMQFDRYNKRVYGILKQLILEGRASKTLRTQFASVKPSTVKVKAR